jgi:hypothetical protein
MAAPLPTVIALALVPYAIGVAVSSQHILHNEHILALPMWAYKNDCWKKPSFHTVDHALSMLQYVPGAGIDEFKPFETVLKDGFMEVDCIMDYMYSSGDKFGDNRHNYKLEEVSNVSIVHYADVVAKEDQSPMSQKVCFEFCRTVPNMGFFGLMNGKCYCAPYYKAEAGDSSQCDSVCPGDPTLMCGGKSKSSVFAMHYCDSTEKDLKSSDEKASSMAKDMDKKAKTATDLSKDMQKAGAALQKKFGQVGDNAASNLMQKAKQSAGKLVSQAEEVEEIAGKLKDLSKKAKEIKKFKDPAEVTEAERIMVNIDKVSAEAAEETAKLDKLTELASPESDSKGAAKEYMPVMWFVDKMYKGVPTTCGGDMVNDPIVGEDADGCAAACNANFQTCVGFSFFGPDKLCFLFSKLNTAFYYTGCKSLLQMPAFLQERAGKAPDVTCYAKLSKFEGTTLKPDPSGKCKQCLKKATKANRCYK